MRRQYITHPRFQFAFTISFVIGVFLVFLLLGVSNVATYKMLAKDPILTDSQRMLLAATTHDTMYLLIISAVVALVVFLGVGLYLSYKFVGPLYRVESWLTECIEKKEYNFMKLRPGDELENIVHILNRMVDKRFGKI